MAIEKAEKIERIEDKKIVGNIDQNIADLETVIEGITNPLTISINGEWGAGKTVFLKEWEKKKPNNSIYIDAFATDFIDNPLAVILSEFTTHYNDSTFFKELLSTQIDYGKITKNGFSEVIKVITAALTKGEASLDLKGLMGSATNPSEAQKNIAYVLDMKEIIKSFKGEIKKAANDEKLYVFIDELDRCRPTYAVEFIEIVKHFFEIDNTVFIFAINRKELVSSIKHVQGCADEDRYLKKFFDLNYDLPPLPTNEFIELLTNDEEKTLGLERDYFDGDFVDTFSLLAKGFHLQPRDIEQAFTKIILALKKHNNKNAAAFMYPLILLAILRDNERNYYKKLQEGNAKPYTLLQEMDIGLKYLKGTSDIEKYIFEKWAEFVRLDKKAIIKEASQEFYQIQNASLENHRNGYVELPEEKSFLDKKHSFLGELKESELDITHGERLIEYIDKLLNFSEQFTEKGGLV